MSSCSKPGSGESFADFFEKWMCGLKDYLPLLMSASKDPLPTSEDQETRLRDLVAELSVHHKQYYAEKWAAAEARGSGEVFLFFAMPWMTTLERAYSWMTGWKPSVAFRIVESLREDKATLFSGAYGNLSEEQALRIDRLREMIRLEEDKVEKDMERQQVALGDKKMVQLVWMARRVKEGDVAGSAEVCKRVEEAIEELGVGMERVMKGGDRARLRTFVGLLEVLSPAQGVGFLGALTVVLLRTRDQGLKRLKDDTRA